MLSALIGGQALTASELAGLAGVRKETASAHLAKLLDAQLLAVHAQGRHRYFSLADDDVAQLLESLMGVAYRAGAVRLDRARASRRCAARACATTIWPAIMACGARQPDQRKVVRYREDGLELTSRAPTSSRLRHRHR